jgi:hypothetical protein
MPNGAESRTPLNSERRLSRTARNPERRKLRTSARAVFAVWDSALFGIRRRSGLRAVWNSAPFGIQRG